MRNLSIADSAILKLVVSILTLLVISICITSVSLAQTLDAQRFSPSPFAGDLFAHARATTLGTQWVWNAGVTLNYQNDPLILKNDAGVVVREVVAHQLTADITGALAVATFLDVGMDVPLHLYVKGEGFRDGNQPKTFSPGDIRLHAKWRFFQVANQFLTLAFAPVVSLPTGKAVSDYTGSIGPTVLLPFWVTLDWNRMGATFSGGYRIVKNQRIADLTIGDQITLNAGAWLWIIQEKFVTIAEYSLAIAAQSPFSRMGEVPMDVIGGVRYFPLEWIHVSLGFGFGLTSGFATPDYRLLGGIVFTRKPDEKPMRRPVGDRDSDGLLDNVDKCPMDAEDIDQFEDGDGCPDNDNDSDGIADDLDRCPLTMEDVDNFDDSDGCPDTDNDNDGVPDEADQCSLVPEDMDNFMDLDGCPDLDNDEDGIPDERDECPMKKETVNRYQDTDGCPDAKATIRGDAITIEEKVRFNSKETTIAAESFPVLDDLVVFLKETPGIRLIMVEGHTDTRGPADRNMTLSQERADAVRTYLVTHGIAEDRVRSQGLGETQPLVFPEMSEVGYEMNRRVEFKVLKMDDTVSAEAKTSNTAAEATDSAETENPKEMEKPIEVQK